MRDKAYRRWREQISKQHVRHVVERVWLDTAGYLNPRTIGKMAHSHCVPCSCYMCGNPRRHWNIKTIAERRRDERDGMGSE